MRRRFHVVITLFLRAVSGGYYLNEFVIMKTQDISIRLHDLLHKQQQCKNIVIT